MTSMLRNGRSYRNEEHLVGRVCRPSQPVRVAVPQMADRSRQRQGCKSIKPAATLQKESSLDCLLAGDAVANAHAR